jgi:hypothetical protein
LGILVFSWEKPLVTTHPILFHHLIEQLEGVQPIHSRFSICELFWQKLLGTSVKTVQFVLLILIELLTINYCLNILFIIPWKTSLVHINIVEMWWSWHWTPINESILIWSVASVKDCIFLTTSTCIS